MKGHLSLRFERRGLGTVMTQNRSTLPLQVSKPMQLDGSGAICVTLLNPTGGLLGGDCLTTEIDLAKGAHAMLTTTSAAKVYRTDSGPAFHRTTVNLAEDAVLEYLPDHVIPHPGSSLDQSLAVEMAPRSRAIILDGFAVGRVARQERWRFNELTAEVLVRRSGRLVYRDRIRIQPKAWVPSGLGGMEGAAYAATMLLCGDSHLDWHGAADAFTSWFVNDRDSNGAATTLPNGGCLLRYQTESAHCLDQVTRALWAMARGIFLNQPPLDLRKR